MPSDAPDFLNWLEGTSDVLVWGKNNEEIEQSLNLSDLVFCLDFNALHRIDEMEDVVGNSSAKKILIDHHLDPSDFADYMISDTSASSTCELVYEFICNLGLKNKIDQGVAEALYCGIMTDTGSFRFPSTTSKTHRFVADLIELGADKNKIHQLIYDSNTLTRLQVVGHCLNNIEIIDDKYALFTLPLDVYKKLNIQKGDTEGVVNYGLSLKTVVLSAFFKEDEGIVKISFRSKNDFDVNVFARKYFNGGGHKNAAGGMSNDSLETTVQRFKTALGEL